MRGRGLKRHVLKQRKTRTAVAPHAGAWIETGPQGRDRQHQPCRPPCGGVD